MSERLKKAFTEMQIADVSLQKAVEQLAEFGTNVPSVNPGALIMMADTTNSLTKSIAFIQSFIRVSLLQQVVGKSKEKKPQAVPSGRSPTYDERGMPKK